MGCNENGITVCESCKELSKFIYISAVVDIHYSVVQGCEFKASLLGDGSLKDSLSNQHQLPQQWFKSCWAKLGHTHKKPNRKSTYTSVSSRDICSILNECKLCRSFETVLTVKEPSQTVMEPSQVVLKLQPNGIPTCDFQSIPFTHSCIVLWHGGVMISITQCK